ncbi:thioredoxin reductase [Coniella lustricola]|uniref:Thioredoxin reductase n=1 Tax=Coniella lustricola TaxID=2025994 RepID=A0A2T3A428_9PEZI|nr:thioredoxin reductase [Coniella lustricola]
MPSSPSAPPSPKIYDVLIIGGGPAGLSVATTIVRQLLTALVLHSHVYRTAHAEHMHGVPGFDHVDPGVFRTRAKGDLLARYDSVAFKRAWIGKVEKLPDGLFQATDGWENTYLGRKVVLATGVEDVLPDIEGFAECWGRGIFHCLFCHGYEERGAESAGLLTQGAAINKAEMLTHIAHMTLQLSKKLTVYTNGTSSDDDKANEIWTNSGIPDFEQRVTVDKRKIKEVKLVSLDTSDVLVTLEDGTEVREKFIAAAPPVRLNAAEILDALNLEMGEAGQIKTYPPFNETSVHGLFAAGDAAGDVRIIPNAIYGGSMAGGGVVMQLLAEKAKQKK